MFFISIGLFYENCAKLRIKKIVIKQCKTKKILYNVFFLENQTKYLFINFYKFLRKKSQNKLKYGKIWVLCVILERQKLFKKKLKLGFFNPSMQILHLIRPVFKCIIRHFFYLVWEIYVSKNIGVPLMRNAGLGRSVRLSNIRETGSLKVLPSFTD